MFSVQQIIAKKRDSLSLQNDEIKWFVERFAKAKIPDYQASALLMAIYINGLDAQETLCMLEAMIHSGEVFDWSVLAKGPLADKHSTGGVGDKTSFIVLPLLIASGCSVPMIAGRGLGHTGGTLDKFEALPGLSTRQKLSKMKKIMKECNGFLCGQTTQLAPADRKMYALRDVTSTVESLPLIVTSILSKKIASGAKHFVFDVKHGNGAFMPELQKARELARRLVTTAQNFGVEAIAALSDMNEPTGSHAGNALELEECLDILAGTRKGQTHDLSLELCAALLAKIFPDNSQTAHRTKLEQHIASGKAFEILSRIAVCQGANARDIERKSTVWLTSGVKDYPVLASSDGFVTGIKTKAIGEFLVHCGAGRKTLTDQIHHRVGLHSLKKLGDKVAKGEVLCVLRIEKENKSLSKKVGDFFEIGEQDANNAKPVQITEWMIK